jgi:replicative superfamily II helicase
MITTQENIADRLSTEILQGNKYFEDLMTKVSRVAVNHLFNSSIERYLPSTKEVIHVLRFADILSSSTNSEARNISFQIISALNSDFGNDSAYQLYSQAVLSRLGNFPGINYVTNKDQHITRLPLEREVEKDYKRIAHSVPGHEDFVFTDSQFTLFSVLKKSKFFSFSGPTSMGKSFIIKAFIRLSLENTPPENIAIIVPTRALINQFAIDLRIELGTDLKEKNYRIITNSNVTELASASKQNYIFILTPERLISYISQKENPSLGYLFIDEAHKIADEKDARSVTSYASIERTLKKFPNINLYFASPNVSNPEIFLKLFNKSQENRFHTTESPVSQNIVFVDFIGKTITHHVGATPKVLETSVFDHYQNANEFIEGIGANVSNIIYCNSKSVTLQKSLEFFNSISSKKMGSEEIPNTELKKAARKIRSFVHKDFYLAEFLDAGVAYHHGTLPQIIRNIIEDLYRNEYIKFMFCTSTLLEGVNMPAKNIFILTNKRNLSPFKPIDFWNLAGRAGRLNKELYGNIYCIKEDEKAWDKSDVLFKRGEIELTPTVISKTDHNLKKLEKLLQNKSVSGTQEEQEILKYIANIICIDTMQIEANYQSPLIDKLIQANREKILEYAKTKVGNIKIPLTILNSNQSIDIQVQNKVFASLKRKSGTPTSIKLPNKVDYDNCLKILQEFYALYEWGDYEKGIKSKESLKYFAVLMNQWISGKSLNQIINESINYQEQHTVAFYIDHANVGPFNREDKKHVNVLIGYIIDDIEKKLRFTFEKYFNHYYLILVDLLGEQNAGQNWALLLEYGTQNRTVIALQNLGYSRHTATYIYNNHRECLIIDDDKLVSIDFERLLSRIDRDSIEYDEIITMS